MNRINLINPIILIIMYNVPVQQNESNQSESSEVINEIDLYHWHRYHSLWIQQTKALIVEHLDVLIVQQLDL